MARRKRRHTARHHRKHRRMGATSGKSFIMDALGLVAGAAAARVLTNSPKVLPNLDAKIKSAGVVAIGVFFPKLVKGELGSAIGNGMIAAGGLGLLQSAGILAGVDDSLRVPVSVMAGDGLSVISGDGAPQVMAGYGMDSLSVISGMEEEYKY
jgi:hypothetical protein